MPKTIKLSEINLGDERYRISSHGDMETLAASIREAGLLHPPRVRHMEGGYVIVTGFRRVRSMETLADLKAHVGKLCDLTVNPVIRRIVK